MSKPGYNPRSVPGNPDVRRFSIHCDQGRRRHVFGHQTPGFTRIFEQYDTLTLEDARERFHREYEFVDEPRFMEVDCG